MKKLLLSFTVFLFALTAIHSQEIKAGISLGLPLGDAKETYSFGMNAESAYLFYVTDDLLIGPQLGVVTYFPKQNDDNMLDDDDSLALFFALAASTRYHISDFFVGADLGYAVGIGNEGGFLYRPKIGYEFVDIGFTLSYSGITTKTDTPLGSVSATLSSISIGFETYF